MRLPADLLADDVLYIESVTFPDLIFPFLGKVTMPRSVSPSLFFATRILANRKSMQQSNSGPAQTPPSPAYFTFFLGSIFLFPI